MIDWNNDGKVDGEDWMLTEMIMDEEDGGGNRNRPSGSCLASFLLILALPVVGIFLILGCA